MSAPLRLLPLLLLPLLGCRNTPRDCARASFEDERTEPVRALSPGVYGLDAAHGRIVGVSGQILGTLAFSMGDANGDCRDDLLVTCPTDDEPGSCVFLAPFRSGDRSASDRDAYFRAHVSGDGGAAGDVNGDGLGDVYMNHQIYLAPFEGEVEPSFPLEGFATSVASGDLDGDGHPDLVVGDTNISSARFHPGPVRKDGLAPAAAVGGYFDKGVALLPRRDPPSTVLSSRARLALVEGLPTEDRDAPDRVLDVAPLFPDDAIFIGAALASDGANRVCIGTDQYRPSRVVCGRVDQLDDLDPELYFRPRPGGGGSLKPNISMTRDLVAVADAWALVNENANAGVVQVKGEAGSWEFEWDRTDVVSPNDAGFNSGVALLRDPVLDLTWLAASAPSEGDGGIIYLFALDTPPTM